jgi:hypothetical protein
LEPKPEEAPGRACGVAVAVLGQPSVVAIKAATTITIKAATTISNTRRCFRVSSDNRSVIMVKTLAPGSRAVNRF